MDIIKNLSVSMEIDRYISQKIANMSAVCAILVVFVHTPVLKSSGSFFYRSMVRFLPNGLSEIAVPFFFLISGFFVVAHYPQSGWYKAAVLKRLKTLLIPYVILNIVWLVYGICVNSALGFAHHDICDILTYIRALGLDLMVTPQVGPLWYVRSLILFLPVVPLLVSVMRQSRFSWLLLGVLFLLYGIVDFLKPYLPFGSGFWSFGVSLKGLAYFGLGIWLCVGRHYLAVPTAVNLRMGVPLILVGLVVMECLPIRFLGVALALVGIWSVVPTWAFPSWLVRNTFALYVFHDMVFAHLKVLIGHGRFSFVYSIPGFIIMAIISVGISIVGSEVLRRKTPRLTRLLLGGR